MFIPSVKFTPPPTSKMFYCQRRLSIFPYCREVNRYNNINLKSGLGLEVNDGTVSLPLTSGNLLRLEGNIIHRPAEHTHRYTW